MNCTALYISIQEFQNPLAAPEDEAYHEKLKLIELVQSYQEIYDKGHPKYYHAKHKATIWRHICRALGYTEIDKEVIKLVKRKWGDIRDYYRDIIKKQIKGAAGGKRSGAEGNYKEVQEGWKFYQEMSFLRPYLYIKE